MYALSPWSLNVLQTDVERCSDWLFSHRWKGLILHSITSIGFLFASSIAEDMTYKTIFGVFGGISVTMNILTYIALRSLEREEIIEEGEENDVPVFDHL